MIQRKPKSEDVMTRQQVAAHLGVTYDHVTKILRDGGLSYCVLRWGRNMTFDARLVCRYDQAQACRRRDGDPCARCSGLLSGYQICGAHLREEGHGIYDECEGGCSRCFGVPCNGEDGEVDDE